jgi:uncharacterized protein
MSMLRIFSFSEEDEAQNKMTDVAWTTKKRKAPISEENDEIITKPEPHIDDIDEVWTHAGCPDGFGAALCYLTYCKWTSTNGFPVIKFLTHGKPRPDARKKNIAMFDFCYEEKEMEEIFREAKSVVVFDHHEGKQELMKKYSNCHYDLYHSGAYLAFKYFFPRLPVPLFIRFIQDRDLWTFEMENTKAFGCYSFYELKFDLDDWYEAFVNAGERTFKSDDDPIYEKMCREGMVYYKIQKKLVTMLARGASRIMVCDIPAAIINTKEHVSEVAEEILANMKEVKLAVVWGFDHFSNLYRVSIRSRKGEVDCTLIAEKYGGSGHKEAAGFKIPSEKSEILTMMKMYNSLPTK